VTSTLDELAAAFVSGSLAKAEWTHEAHLRVGLWHVLRHEREDALALLRERIRALNEGHGVANSDAGGYHETITRFYVEVLADFASAAPAGEDEDALAGRLIAELGARDLPLRFWSRERLMSVQARRHWLEPDLGDYRRPGDRDDASRSAPGDRGAGG
jgi:hypothetical protein